MNSPEPRKKYNVGAWKIPYAERDVAHAVISDEDEHGYQNILGADTMDDDDRFPVGAKTAYLVELTEREAELFAAASNCRYVEAQQNETNTRFIHPSRTIDYPPGTFTVPSLITQAWQRVRYVDMSQWHGRDVLVCNMDGKPSSAVLTAMQLTQVGYKDFSGNPGGLSEHACLSTSVAVPPGGRVLHAQIWGANDEISDTGEAQAIIWAADNGAKLANFEADADSDDTNFYLGGSVMADAMAHARDVGMHIVCAAGNANRSFLTTPGNYCRKYANVHTSIAFDESTDRRAPFSNHDSTASGCTPGVDVLGVNSTGAISGWNGTSASTPNMCQMMARAMTGARFSANQVGSAFKSNTRDTGAGASQQGGGAYDLHRALSALGAVPATSTIAGPYTSSVFNVRGVSGFFTAVNVPIATGIVAGDMQLVFLVSSLELDTLTGTAGWQIICDHPWPAGWETGPIGKTRVRVLARAYAEGDPSSPSWTFNGATHDMAMAIMTLRGALGVNPKDFVPIARFGDAQSLGTGSPTTVPVLPNTANDLQICMFAQRQETSVLSASLSVPTGLTDRGFYRPSGTRTLGYALRVATRQLTDGNRTPAYTSTSNDPDGTWVSVALTIPSSNVDPPPTAPPPEQELPQGPTSGVVAFMPHA